MGAFIAAAYIDVRRRRIPNALSYMIGSLGLLRILLMGDPLTAGCTLAAAAGVLVVGFMFF
jgi:Flp pilus assembly protein protease CpaA